MSHTPKEEDCDLFDLEAMYPAGWDSVLDRSSPSNCSGTMLDVMPALPASLETPLASFGSPLLRSPVSPTAANTQMSFCWLHSKKRALGFLQEITPGSRQYRCVPGHECKFAEPSGPEEFLMARGSRARRTSWDVAGPRSDSPAQLPLQRIGSHRAHEHPDRPPMQLLTLPSPAMESQSSGGGSIGPTPDPTPQFATGGRDAADPLEEAIDEFILRSAGDDGDGPDDHHEHYLPELGSGEEGRRPKRGKKKRKTPAEDNPALDPARYKTKLCKNWQLHEKCCYGPRCLFAHGHREIRSYGAAKGNPRTPQQHDQQDMPPSLMGGPHGDPYASAAMCYPPQYGGSYPYPVAMYSMPAGVSPMSGDQPNPYFVYGA